MAHKYTITTPSQSLTLDATGKTTVAYTVTNVSGQIDRAMAKVVAQGSTKAEWLTIAGDSERDFTPNGVNQFDVNVAVPQGTKAGTYAFRFDMTSALRRTGEEYDEGPTVHFKVAEGQRSLWWIWVAAAVVLIVVGISVWYLLQRKVVPGVNGEPFIAAIRTLQETGFQVGLDGRKDATVDAGIVLDQSPGEGERTGKGSLVTLTVATRRQVALDLAKDEATRLSDAEAARLEQAVSEEEVADEVAVPRVNGLKGDTAMLRIYQAGLIPDPIPVVANGSFGTVIGLRPPAGSKVARQSHVTVVIAQNRFHPWLLDPHISEMSPLLKRQAEIFREKSMTLPSH
ncbi:MAG: PASTA domain-containing protein [Thermoanaerobaculia bacterium]